MGYVITKHADGSYDVWKEGSPEPYVVRFSPKTTCN